MLSTGRAISSMTVNLLRSNLLQRKSLKLAIGAQAPQMNLSRKYGNDAVNTIINFVPTQEAWVIERMEINAKITEIRLKKKQKENAKQQVELAISQRIKYVQSLKEMAIEIPKQEAITVDNVQLQFDAVLYLRITNPYKASYGVEDPEFAITQLAQTTMRSEVGKIQLDTVFRERQVLNTAIVESMNSAAEPWGLICMRYEIRTVTMPEEIQKAMRMQVEAERKKRAAILESEGIRQSNMNVAEGEKQARILRSEAEMTEQINSAQGVARAIELEAEARRKALDKISEALNKNGGSDAASLLVAEQYVKAFKNLAKEANTLILPANAGDVSSMVSQAMAVYKQISKTQSTTKN